MNRELAVIDGSIKIGCRDVGSPCVWFSVRLAPHGGSLIVLSWTEAEKYFKEAGVYDIVSLTDKPCWVSVKDHIVTFEGFYIK